MAKKKEAQKPEVITSYKGFSRDWKCREFQYEIGKSYEHDGDVAACKSGFHACEYPLDVFLYYAPADSVFAVVEQSGNLARHDEDSKVASSKIRIAAQISLPGLIKAAIEYTFSKATPENSDKATGYSGAASATGRYGRVMGKFGCAIFAVERDDSWNIISAACGIVGKDGLKPEVWYWCRDGKLVEVE